MLILKTAVKYYVISNNNTYLYIKKSNTYKGLALYFRKKKKNVITRQNESKRFSITSKSESACIGYS